MKKIGIIIGSEKLPLVDFEYYKKHKKEFDNTIKEFNLKKISDLTYDIQIYSILKHLSPKNVSIVPLWKLEFTKKDIEELDLVFCLYEAVYSLRDYGPSGYNKYFYLINTNKTKIVEDIKFQKFVLNKQRYYNFFKNNNIPVMDTIFYNIENYKKNKNDVKNLLKRIIKNFEGPIFCKPEMGAFAVGTQYFEKITEDKLKIYLNKLIKLNFKKLLIQPYISEFLKFYEIKTMWLNGKFQYAYGQKVTSDEDDILQSEIDPKLLNMLIKKGKNVIELLQEKFEIPLIIRIDWACCLQNDNVCRDYYLNEIEQVPGMLGTDSEKYDWFEKLSKSLLKMV